ncbi:MAG: histidine kinase dimerization/phospho-acceptor domain-containing protein [Ktedonobacteraceae bacterium]
MRLTVGEKRPLRVVDWLNARLSLIFGAIMVLFLLSNGVSFYAFNAQRHLDDQKILLRGDVESILQAMNDQQTGLRGYISGNNSAFLQAFQQGRTAYSIAVDNLTTQLQTGPFRHTNVRLTAVEEVADEWYNNYALVQINHMQTSNFAGPRSEASILQGNDLFDQFRTAQAQLQESIGQDLQGYQSQVDTINISLAAGAIVLFLAANAALLWLLRNFTGTLNTQVQRLTHTTQQLGQGERTARVDPLNFSDLDQVGQSINSMAVAIQQHEDAAEEAMRTLEHQYTLVERAQGESRAIFDSSSEAFLFISAAGQVHALNRPFCEFFGLTAEEVVGMSFSDLQRRWEPLFVNADVFHADLAQDSADQERQHLTTATQKEPQYRELSVSSTPVLSSTATYLGRLYVLRDITREREAERLKAEFYALVSHGLRTPLTSIKGYVDLLTQQDEVGPLNELQEEFLGIVQSNARRLVSLVNDLIDQSRLEAQTLVIQAVPLDLHAIIHNVSQSMRPQIDERQQTLSLHLAPVAITVLGDENRVEQIVANILTFTTNHTPEGGQIIWETQPEGMMVRITCSSNGEVSPEDLAAFNRPFFHDAAAAPAETMGGVLGPSIARSLVELHGGVLQMSSTPGEGSTLTCTLPLTTAPVATLQANAHV